MTWSALKLWKIMLTTLYRTVLEEEILEKVADSCGWHRRIKHFGEGAVPRGDKTEWDDKVCLT